MDFRRTSIHVSLGLMQSIISLSAKTAEAGITPPESALPKIKISGLAFSIAANTCL